jgi:2'-5' RNA ligase
MLDAIRIAYDQKPFAPHVTLLRNVARGSSKDAPIDPPIIWSCHAPTVVRSKQGPNGVTYIPVVLV